jgi:hypothetical protein
MQHLSDAQFLTIRKRLVVIWLSRFGAVYQGVVTTRGVSVACIRVSVIAIRCKSAKSLFTELPTRLVFSELSPPHALWFADPPAGLAP